MFCQFVLWDIGMGYAIDVCMRLILTKLLVLGFTITLFSCEEKLSVTQSESVSELSDSIADTTEDEDFSSLSDAELKAEFGDIDAEAEQFSIESMENEGEQEPTISALSMNHGPQLSIPTDFDLSDLDLSSLNVDDQMLQTLISRLSNNAGMNNHNLIALLEEHFSRVHVDHINIEARVGNKIIGVDIDVPVFLQWLRSQHARINAHLLDRYLAELLNTPKRQWIEKKVAMYCGN